MIAYSTNELRTISDVLGHRAWHVEHKINQLERKELNVSDPRRRDQIEKYLTEAEALLGLLDKTNACIGDAG